MESSYPIDYAINALSFTPTGVQCADANTADRMHKFLREAILDNHIPIRKVIGVKVIAGKKMDNALSENTRLSHHPALGESYPELVKNMFDKVICTPIDGKDVDIELHLGTNTAKECKLMVFGTDVKMVYTNPMLATHIGDDGTHSGDTGFVLLRLHTSLVTGYRSFADNSKIIPAEYFPSATDASLSEFVRVLPMQKGDTYINMRYYHDFTCADFAAMLSIWKREWEAGKLPAKEKEWVQNFVM